MVLVNSSLHYCSRHIELGATQALRSLATSTGLEPATSAVTGRRSNQLSYEALHRVFVEGCGTPLATISLFACWFIDGSGISPQCPCGLPPDLPQEQVVLYQASPLVTAGVTVPALAKLADPHPYSFEFRNALPRLDSNQEPAG